MGRKRHGKPGRRSSQTFVMFPHKLLQHESFHALSSRAVKAVMYLAGQYNGSNNGDMTIAWKIAKKSGFGSNGNLRLGVLELIDAGFVIQSRQGGRNHCSLFALTWFAVDDCNGKLDIPATNIAPNTWNRCQPAVQSSEPRAVQLVQPAVQSALNNAESGVH